jgi:hypothetical protein
LKKLLFKIGWPNHKLKKAYRYFDYCHFAKINLRCMRTPENTDIPISLEKISVVSPQQKATGSMAQVDE